jgi:acetolactate synthase-1/2/3 large subunit
MPSAEQVTAAQRLLELSAQLGVEYIFTNLGSDHPAFIEAFARLRASELPMPKIIVCPHEMTTLSAAHGYAMITRRPQIVLVHVDVGTQNLGGSVHNAARGRIPAIIVAGLSPVTDRGTRVGQRNEFIHYLQDVPRQHEIVGQYMKWCYELRAGEMVDGVLLRGIQIATSAPQGPVYITGAREIWEEPASSTAESPRHWPTVRHAGLREDAVEEIYQALCQSKRPIVITTSLGRQVAAFDRLVELSDRIGIGVCEASPQYVNFPGSHAHHLSSKRDKLIDEADLILMLDVDVPWTPSKVQPAADARLFCIDQDPIKQDIGFWHIPSEGSYQADSLYALEQLLKRAEVAPPGREQRVRWIREAKARLAAEEPALPTSGPITAAELTAAVRELVHEQTVLVLEEPSSTEIVPTALKLDRPGSYFASGASGLGWGVNAAIGAKLARPDAEVISLVGDGCYLFSVPSSAYWVAYAYKTPQLTIIYNNGGWHSPKLSTVWVHPEGDAARNDTYWVTTGAGARLSEIGAAAGDAAAFSVSAREQLAGVLQEALGVVRSGRCAIVDVRIAPISSQVL